MGSGATVFSVAAARVGGHHRALVLSMALAVAIGVLIATGRVYGGSVARVALLGVCRVIRGTPVLLQLFVLYYGLASASGCPPLSRRCWDWR